MFSNMEGTKSTGVAKIITETFKIKLNAGWRKVIISREPGRTDGTTTDAKVTLGGDDMGEVATIPVNIALLTRVSGRAKLEEDIKDPANQSSAVKKAASLATGFVFE